MVADNLALSLAARHVRAGDAVLDPFCGSGRLLAAVLQPSVRVGIDTNPLACLLTRAKLADADVDVLTAMLAGLHRAREFTCASVLRPGTYRRVEWFTPAALRELGQIVSWINALGLAEPERLLAAAALSGAARDVSFARKNGWKLHRLAAEARANFTASAWTAFERRLRYCQQEVLRRPLPAGRTQVELADARRLHGKETVHSWRGAFNVVLTSPPYGDSRTTVQYGAASSLCLYFVSRIDGFQEYFASGGSIDAQCLGGVTLRLTKELTDIRPYWAGRKGTRIARNVARFLADYGNACDGIAQCLRPGGTAVLVVGQRSTGGFRLKLDRFTADCLDSHGLVPVSIEHHCLREKWVPLRINRFGRCASSEQKMKGLTKTISNEVILEFQKCDL
jgi:site-specific DNA-methyltransferase (cytosine-N4-specific)